MREVFSHHDHARVGFFKSVLEDAGITTFVKNEASFNTTELTAIIVSPTLCVVNDEDFERAREIIKSVGVPPAEAPVDWKCGRCGEEVPGTFDTCWSCGATRDSTLAGGDAPDA